MGVRGLSSFIHDHASDCFDSYQLKNQRIIIDGNNIMFKMYHGVKQYHSIFGGDYDKVYNYAKKFMSKFLECNIELLLVFDGCTDPFEGKYQQKLQRMCDSIQSGLKLAPYNQQKYRIFSTLVPDIFVDVLNELDIPFINCLFDADAQIATLAKLYNCPVVSDDSDFFIHDVPFIKASSLEDEIEINEDGVKYLGCVVFNRVRFAQKFNFNASLLPLVGSLLGNDYVPFHMLYKIYGQVSLPKKKRIPDQHKRIFGLLKWIEDQDVDFAIERHLEALKKEERSKVAKVIQEGIESYETKLNSQVWAFLSTLDPSFSLNLPEDVILVKESFDCPDWFVDLFLGRKISPLVWQIYARNVLLTDSQVECVSLPSANISCFPIICAISNVVNPQITSMKVFCRKNRKLETWMLDPSIYLPSVPIHLSIDSLHSVSLEARNQYFMSVMNVTDESASYLSAQLPPECLLYFYSVIFWLNNSSVTVKYAHLLSLMMCFIIMYGIENLRGFMSRNIKHVLEACESHTKPKLLPSDKSVIELIKCFHDDECVLLKSKVIRFFTINEKVKSKNYSFDRKTVHCFSELQNAYKYAHALNGLLLNPVQDCCIGLLFNGTFLYTMSQEMFLKNDPWEFVYSEFKLCPNFITILRKLMLHLSKMLRPQV